MTARPIDLADILAHHYTTPAPRTSDLPTVAFKACGCGVWDGEECDCADMAAQLKQANRRPIIFRLNTRRAA